MMAKLLLPLLLLLWDTVQAHNYLSDKVRKAVLSSQYVLSIEKLEILLLSLLYCIKDHVNKMKIFSSTPGVMTSFENSLVSGEHFIGYSGWEKINRQYSVQNVTIIVRIEFDRFSYKHRRLKKTYNR